MTQEVEALAWPPAALPVNHTDTTLQDDAHAADHNNENLAIADLVSEVLAFENRFLPKYKVDQQGQAIVTSNEFGHSTIFPPGGLTGNYPIILADNMQAGTDPWWLVGVASIDAAAGKFDIYTRWLGDLNVWHPNGILRICWMAVSAI